MLLRNLLSVAAAAATVFAGPCKPRSSVTSSETAASGTLSSFTTVETTSTVLATETTAASESAGTPTESDSTTVFSAESQSTTINPTATTEFETASTITGTTSVESSTAVETSIDTTETSTVTETATTAPGSSTTETSAESSSVAESTTTTTSVFVPLPTFGLVARGVSNAGHQFDGDIVASPTSVSNFLKVYAPGSAPANWPTSFHIDGNTGRLLNGAGQAFCAQTVIFNALQDPAALYPCNANTQETSGTFAERVLTCTQSSVGELECTMTAFSNPFRYFFAYGDGSLGISTTTANGDSNAYLSLKIVDP
ncbi:hypothetical protein FBEOM_9592 [Fusarium beomiforme]|uniref:Uncharacterized protein n=1 Tax=Fusarium beomiforme TaxID=44412 RepID=A0A9P5DV29_9HYPO|nr:hypothetical protein FBEOM_9592 [Fusarium beomiforme]